MERARRAPGGGSLARPEGIARLTAGRAARTLVTIPPRARDAGTCHGRRIIRREIEAALFPLIGLPLASASRVVDMATFGFGPALPPGIAAAPAVVAQYSLHVQELWRITRHGEILVGYGDYFYPPSGSRVPRGQFVARDAPRTRRDELLDDWVRHDPAGPHVVAAVRGTRAGDLAITFVDGCLLETFASSVSTAADGSDEFWRLIPPRVTGAERSLIVTAHGIEP